MATSSSVKVASTSFWTSLKEEARRNYITIFEQEWPTWLAGILLALVSLAALIEHLVRASAFYAYLPYVLDIMV